jgi:hypothetical protein
VPNPARRVRDPWWVLAVIVIAGAVLGSVFADAVGQFTYLAPLSHSISIGIEPPMRIDLRVLTMTVGFTVRLNLAIVLGILLAIYVFRML